MLLDTQLLAQRDDRHPPAWRVALPEGSLVVNSSQGGGSKDTWVLASRTSEGDRELSGAKVVTTSGVAAARPAESAPDPVHTQTQQQQQGSMMQQLSGTQQMGSMMQQLGGTQQMGGMTPQPNPTATSGDMTQQQGGDVR